MTRSVAVFLAGAVVGYAINMWREPGFRYYQTKVPVFVVGLRGTICELPIDTTIASPEAPDADNDHAWIGYVRLNFGFPNEAVAFVDYERPSDVHPTRTTLVAGRPKRE